MRRKYILTVALALLINSLAYGKDDGELVDSKKYIHREILPDPGSKSCPEIPVTLTQVSGNLYRHTKGGAYSGFVLITKDGALVIDPAQTCTAIRLRDEIKSRFHTSVKYVVYTHAHFDHIGGGQVFQKDGATIVAHRNAVEPIVGEKLPTAVPDRTFEKDMKIELGDEIVELHYVAPSHSNSLALVYFPKYKALQCTDVCGADSLPFNELPDFYYEGWIETLKWIQTLDVEVVDTGHRSPGTKAQQRALMEYMQDLHEQVLSLVRKGEPWDQIYRDIKFKDEYKKWSGYDNMRILNVLGMYRWVNSHRRGVW